MRITGKDGFVMLELQRAEPDLPQRAKSAYEEWCAGFAARLTKKARPVLIKRSVNGAEDRRAPPTVCTLDARTASSGGKTRVVFVCRVTRAGRILREEEAAYLYEPLTGRFLPPDSQGTCGKADARK